jgi:pimeloyl-ACP methyl ester carboxylesterase
MPPVKNIEVYFESSGDAGPPVVLVHGSGDLRDWAAVVRLLARSCRVSTYDRRGHGPIERLLPRGTLQDDVRDLTAVIEHLGIAPAHVVGMSFGAVIVLNLLIERPDLFSSATIHEPPLFDLVEDEVLPAARSDSASVAWPAEAKEPGGAQIDLEALASFGGPLLMTEGDQSPRLLRNVLDQIGDALPRAQRHVFRGAGHAPHLTHPDDFALVVGSFISGVHVL